MLGKIEELGDSVYKAAGNDKAEKFIRTTEDIADYVGVQSGPEMRVLVKYRKETTYTKPKAPLPAGITTRAQKKADDADSVETDPDGGESTNMTEYKADLEIYHRDSRKYRENKAKTFVIILGQCTEDVKSVLLNGGGLAQLEIDSDVVGILNKLEAIAMSTTGVDEEYVTLAGSFRRLASLQQGPKESVAKYHKRFMISANVLAGQWGDFHPSKLATNITKDEAKDKFLARLFLTGADKVRFGQLIENLKNNHISKKDNYPESLEATLRLLSNYQETQKGSGKYDSLGHSFAQTQKKNEKKCYLCGGTGHIKKDCPNRTSLAQATNDDDSADETTSRASVRQRRRSGSRDRRDLVAWSTSDY